MKQITIVAKGEDGHRREYLKLFSNIFSSSGLSVEIRPLGAGDLFNPNAIFSPMLEEHSLAFMLLAIGRSILGRTSSALLFRPTEALYSNAATHRVKRAGLKLLRWLPGCSVLTILPFAVDKRFSEIATDWIYDPQLWDVDASGNTPDTSLSAEIIAAAGARTIVVALGAQNNGKGFDYFADIWKSSAPLREKMLFVAAGRVSPQSASNAALLSVNGGMVIDRFITDDELTSLYRAAGMVWSCYSPEYDQASGIFGRAVQYGIPSIIRAGSHVERLAQLLQHQSVVIPWDDAENAALSLLSPRLSDRAAPSNRTKIMREQALTTLSQALGAPLQGT